MTRLLFGFAFLAFASMLSAADWPQWRGPGRDNKVSDFAVPQSWPKELIQKWKVKVGDGVASPVLVGDKAYVFARVGGDEVISCLAAETGKEIWSDKFPAPEIGGPARNFKGPRGTPVLAEGKVCTFGTNGTVSCYDALTGKLAWRKETKGTPGFKTSYSPVIADGKCIVHIGGGGGRMGGGGGGGGGGGKGEVVAYDLKTGNEAWKWSGEAPAYASAILMTVDAIPMVVVMTEKNAVGLALADGKLLWETPFSAARYGNTVTPIADGDTLIVSGQGTGTMAAKIIHKGSEFTVKQLWKVRTSPHMYNSPILKDGKIYGISEAKKIYCLDAKTGDEIWIDSTPRGQCGAILDAGTVLLALSSDQNLLAFKPNEKKYEELARIKVADSETWTVPIVTGKRVFVKDKDSLILWSFE